MNIKNKNSVSKFLQPITPPTTTLLARNQVLCYPITAQTLTSSSVTIEVGQLSLTAISSVKVPKIFRQESDKYFKN
jgi:hypothetical protein